MSQKILQINFNFSIPADVLAQAFAPLAQPIADTPGLRWKVWLWNPDEGESGGIYLFDDEAALQAYVAGPIIGGLKENPAVSDIDVKVYGVAEEYSLVTRAPIRETAKA
jgi:hypothetical protein